MNQFFEVMCHTVCCSGPVVLLYVGKMTKLIKQSMFLFLFCKVKTCKKSVRTF